MTNENALYILAGNRACVNFRGIRNRSIAVMPALLCCLLPNGRLFGNEYQSLNPKRDDSRIGSFSINIKTGMWADFATGDKGGDIISLVAYLDSSSAQEAAQKLIRMIGECNG